MSGISKNESDLPVTSFVCETACSRRRALHALLVGIPLAIFGCSEPIKVPFSTTISLDTPVTVKWSINSELVNSPTSVLKASSESVILVTGELFAKTGISFARCPKGAIIHGGFDLPPLAIPKNSEKPYDDKPDDQHVFLILYLAYVRGEGREEEPLEEIGVFNQVVTFDQKELRFSGGIRTPKKTGRYVLRLCASFIPEKDCKSDKDRMWPHQSGMKVLAASRIQIE